MSGQIHNLSWVNPTTNTDGSAFAAQTDTAGYEIQIDSTGVVSIPIGYATTFDLSTLAVWPTLKSGTHTVALATVTKEGVTGLFGTASFLVLGIPQAPTNMVVA